MGDYSHLRLLLLLPLLGSVLTVLAVALTALAWRRGFWSVPARLHYTLLCWVPLRFCGSRQLEPPGSALVNGNRIGPSLRPALQGVRGTLGGPQLSVRGLPLRFALTAAGLATTMGAAWLGLRKLPAPFNRFPAATPNFERVPIPADLPEPAAHYARAALGDSAPVITSAVITGVVTCD